MTEEKLLEEITRKVLVGSACSSSHHGLWVDLRSSFTVTVVATRFNSAINEFTLIASFLFKRPNPLLQNMKMKMKKVSVSLLIFYFFL